MQKYDPKLHDPRDDRQPWAVMMPARLGGYYLASDVDHLLHRISVEAGGCGPKCSEEFLRMALTSVIRMAASSQGKRDE